MGNEVTIDTLQIELESNAKGAVSGLEALANSLERIKKLTKGGLGLSGATSEVVNMNKKLSASNNDVSKSYVNLYAKFKTWSSAFKTGLVVFNKFITASSDYVENLNLFTVSMGEYADEAKRYAEEVGDVLGIDPGEWMRNQGVFMTLAKGFGVTSDRANLMSKNLTQLGYDLSSFFNISTEDAMQKLQSGIAGELEPLRRIGYDLSQARLELEAYNLGIKKKVSEMTQAEKAELRYYAIMTQVTDAQGDMARTLDAPANQLRILKAQVTQATRSIGNLFIPILNKVLPVANAVLQVLRSLADTIARLFGIEIASVDFESASEAAGGISEGMEDASESAKKLRDYTMGFDELNVISPGSDSSATDNSTMGGGFDFELPEYDFISDATQRKVNEIVDKMREWLGITDEIDSWGELMETRFGRILSLVGNVAIGLLTWKVTTEFISAITTLKMLLASPSYTIAIGVILTVAGITLEINGIKDAIKNGLDGFNFGEILGGGALTVGGTSMLGTGIGKFIASAFKGSAVAKAITAGGGTISTGLIGAAVGGLVAGIPMFVTGIYDAIVNGLSLLNSLLIPAGATMSGAAIGAIIGMLGGPITAGIGALIGLAVGAVTDLVILIVQNWDAIAQFFVNMWDSVCTYLAPVGEWFNTNIIQPIANFFKGLWNTVSGYFINLWNDISATWNTVATWFDTCVIQPLVIFFSGLVLRIGQFFEGCWILIQAVWVVVSTWFNDIVIQPLIEFFNGLKESVSTFFSDLWNNICAIWGTVSTWFNDTVIQPVVTYFKGVWDSVSQFFTNLWSDIKLVWKGVSTWFNETIIIPVKNAFDVACKAISGFFSSLWSGIQQGVANAMNGVIGVIESAINWIVGGINELISGFDDIVQWGADVIGVDWGGVTLVKEVQLKRITVPTYATGGFPETGEMFVAREAGAEMVGSIGRRTAVANNDQIVAGIASGVADANAESNSLLREQNTLLRALLDKETGTYIDGRKLSKELDRVNRGKGVAIIAGGAY